MTKKKSIPYGQSLGKSEATAKSACNSNVMIKNYNLCYKFYTSPTSNTCCNKIWQRLTFFFFFLQHRRKMSNFFAGRKVSSVPTVDLYKYPMLFISAVLCQYWQVSYCL